MWAGNVFVKQQDDEFVIEGIIDFERAFWGDPLADFAGSVMLMDHIFEEEDVFRIYKNKSNMNKDITKADKIRSTFYSLYIYTIMTVETFRYSFPYSKMQRLFAMKNIKRCLRTLEEEI